MNKPTQLSALAAALKILKDSPTPLHYKEITRRILDAGLWHSLRKMLEITESRIAL